MISISVRNVTLALGLVTAAFMAAGLASALGSSLIDRDSASLVVGFVLEQFDLDGEGNLPTWYQSGLLLLSSGLIFLIAKGQTVRWHARYWGLLSALFLVGSIDEIVGFHNRTQLLLPVEASGFLHFGWVAFGIIAVVVIAAVFWRFVRSLPRETSLLLVAAAVVYLCGALVTEIVSGPFADAFGEESPSVRGLALLEESLEMVGLTVFVFAFLHHLERQFGSLRVDFGGSEEPGGRPATSD